MGYDAEKIPNYISQDRHPRRDHLSFGSGRARFDEGRQQEDVFFGHQQFATIPGPGAYQPKSARDRVVGASAAKALRPPNRVGATTEAVGPGSYSNIETHMLKKTYNISTHAPVSNDRGMPRRPLIGKAM